MERRPHLDAAPTAQATFKVVETDERRTLLAELGDFIHDYPHHGSLTANATTPAWNGDLLVVVARMVSSSRGGSHQRLRTAI